MIGRDEQLGLILSQVHATAAGGASQNVLFVTGESGIGKSTLLRAVCEAAGALQPAPLVALAECSTPLAGENIGEMEALEPWAAIMRALAGEEEERRNETRKLVADIAMAWVHCIPVVGDVVESVFDTAKIVRERMNKGGAREPAPAAAASQQQVFQQYINFLDRLAEAAPVLLLLDDFHWADSSSSNLLFAAARQLAGRRVLFVVAYRPDDAATARGEGGHPLLEVRNALERYSLAAEIGVPRMTPENLDALLRVRYRNYRNNDEFEEWIARVSSGNALFITQYLETLEEDGVIDRERGAIMETFRDVKVPGSVQAVIAERIRRLGEDARELLRYASVEGDTFTAAMLAQITETPQLKLMSRLRIIESTHQLIRSLGKQRIYTQETTAYQFSHALLHKAMYESLEPEERELLHELILNALRGEWDRARENSTNLPGLAARLAVHARVLGEYRFAAGALLEGARASWLGYAEQETMGLLDALFNDLRSAEADAGMDNHLRLVAGRAHMLRGDVHLVRSRLEAMLESFRTAQAILADLPERTDWIDATNRLAHALHWLGNIAAAEEAAREALAEAERTGYAAGIFESLNALGHVSADHGTADELLRLRLKAVEAAQAVGIDTPQEARALNNLGIVQRLRGDSDAAAACYRRSLEISVAIGDRTSQATVLNNLASLHINCGEEEEALSCLQRCREICRATGNDWTGAYCLHNLGFQEHTAGRYHEALRHYGEALALAERIGDTSLRAGTLRNMGELHRQHGRASEAIACYGESLELYESIGNLDEIAYTCAGFADTERGSGALEAARVHAERSLALATQLDSPERKMEAFGALAMIEEAEAVLLEGEARARRHADAVAHLRECVLNARAAGTADVGEWEAELERLKGRA